MTATKPGPELIDPTGTTSGHVLTSTGGSTAPTFQAAGGGWEFVSRQTADGDSSIDFTGFTTGYDYQICTIGMDNTADGTIFCRVGTGETPTYQATNYIHERQASANSVAYDTGTGSGTDTKIALDANQTGGAGAGEYGSVILTILDPGNSTYPTYVHWHMGHQDVAGQTSVHHGYGAWETTTAVTAFQLYPDSTTFVTGDFILFRRANA